MGFWWWWWWWRRRRWWRWWWYRVDLKHRVGEVGFRHGYDRHRELVRHLFENVAERPARPAAGVKALGHRRVGRPTHEARVFNQRVFHDVLHWKVHRAEPFLIFLGRVLAGDVCPIFRHIDGLETLARLGEVGAAAAGCHTPF